MRTGLTGTLLIFTAMIQTVTKQGLQDKKHLIDDEERVKQSIRRNPSKFFYAKDESNDTNGILPKFMGHIAYFSQKASNRPKEGIGFVSFFPRQGGSISSKVKHLRFKNKIRLTVVEINPKSFPFLSKTLRNDNDYFD